MQRYLFQAAVLIGTFIIQIVVVPHINLSGAQPDLILVVVVCFALTEGLIYGAASGFGGGFLEDLLQAKYMGFNMLIKTVVGAIAGIFKDYGPKEGILIPLVAVFSASVFSQVMMALMAFLFGETVVFKSIFNWLIIPTALYNVLFTPFIYPAVVKIVNWQQKWARFEAPK